MEHHAAASTRQSWLPALLAVAVIFAAVVLFLRQQVLAPDPVVAAGRADFGRWCAPCHGASGTGNGPLAAKLDPRPADLTLIAKREGDAFRVDDLITYVDGRAMLAVHGPREMPEWGPIFEATAGADPDAAARARDRLRSITYYLWTIQR
jgi:mono/diheme cytochrome c family protein